MQVRKNLGQAGMNIVVIRDDLLKEALPATPTLYQYKFEAEHHGFYNTPHIAGTWQVSVGMDEATRWCGCE